MKNMTSIEAINLMGLLRQSPFAERGDVDEQDFRHLWLGTYEVRIAGTDRYYRIDPRTGDVRRIVGFSTTEAGEPAGHHAETRWEQAERINDEERARIERDRIIQHAREMRADGKSLFQIATALGVTKEWLRAYAGL